ncbi:MAG: mechanosensitive ion channel, partial [Desulfobacterales bacterium]|nr:mechanosensitive ion channel [Desulfobacterales bacterium]
EIVSRASSLFERTPLGWQWDTLSYLYHWGVGLPGRLPEFMGKVMEQSRILGAAGSLIVLVFLVAVFYSLLGRNRLMVRLARELQPLQAKLPPKVYPFFLSGIKVAVSALIPLLLLAAFSLINALIDYRAAWFRFAGHLLWLWAVGALLINLLRELLTQNLFPATARYGPAVFPMARLAILYVLASFAVIRGAEAFPIRPDVFSLLKFVISVSIVGVLFLLHLMKNALLSFLPRLPYKPFQTFTRLLERFYYPFIFFAFLTALLWCIGYRQLGQVVLTKVWTSGMVYILIMVAYDRLQAWLQQWYARKGSADEAVAILFQSLKSMLLYATVTVALVLLLNLLGLLETLKAILSFPIVNIGGSPVTLWLIVKAVLILMAFVYFARLLQAYLDYKIYPSFGIDAGLGYALNTSFKYTLLLIGALIALKSVGIDLRFLLVFAGAAGIGIGLGMQHIAANVISGFTIIFGGKIRRGDWIETEGTLGVVTDIYLRATRVKTRDNIEYLIPNSNIISNTIVNYSLSSPLIRISLPVGVSYSSDPQQVRQILQEAAEKEPLVSKFEPPMVRFVGYGDSSLDFALLFWIDVRRTPRRLVRSALYFAIFERFRQAGIEIPFPQRDLHIRSSVLPAAP